MSLWAKLAATGKRARAALSLEFSQDFLSLQQELATATEKANRRYAEQIKLIEAEKKCRP